MYQVDNRDANSSSLIILIFLSLIAAIYAINFTIILLSVSFSLIKIVSLGLSVWTFLFLSTHSQLQWSALALAFESELRPLYEEWAEPTSAAIIYLPQRMSQQSQVQSKSQSNTHSKSA